MDYQPGLLALWLPGNFGQWEASAGDQRTDETVWSGNSPASSRCSSVVAKFMYL